jgi:hypothetical protein
MVDPFFPTRLWKSNFLTPIFCMAAWNGANEGQRGAGWRRGGIDGVLNSREQPDYCKFEDCQKYNYNYNYQFIIILTPIPHGGGFYIHFECQLIKC